MLASTQSMREAPLHDWPEGALTASPAGTGSTTPNAPTGLIPFPGSTSPASGPTPASIAAQVQLVEPGLVLPRQAPAGLEAPQELHIHVEHLHIHIPQGLSELQGTPD